MSSRIWPAVETVPLKFYFWRRQHAVEFVAELNRLEEDERRFSATLSQTFSGGRQTWMVVTDWQVLWYGPVLAAWFRTALERWALKRDKPTEGKLA
jgi:hypothetical protein